MSRSSWHLINVKLRNLYWKKNVILWCRKVKKRISALKVAPLLPRQTSWNSNGLIKLSSDELSVNLYHWKEAKFDQVMYCQHCFFSLFNGNMAFKWCKEFWGFLGESFTVIARSDRSFGSHGGVLVGASNDVNQNILDISIADYEFSSVGCWWFQTYRLRSYLLPTFYICLQCRLRDLDIMPAFL